MSEAKPKAVRPGYGPTSFFFTQTHDQTADTRLVAWAPSLEALRLVFEQLIDVLPESVEVLLKVKADEEPIDGDEQTWVRHYGVVARGALREAMVRCEVFVYQDSRNQLCVRDPVSFDYVVLDDAGVVYVYCYSGNGAFRQVFVDAEFEERTEALVNEGPYWMLAPPEGGEQEREFVRLLRLSPASGPGEPEDAVH